ncbi:MAG: CvpA family protein [Chloroflexi bacterium]|nr:MAG: CvpA family protein [Chloroflexota bacterium]TMD64677.1 MAG: CvpA family protein [Chloroflexota bacterium]
MDFLDLIIVVILGVNVLLGWAFGLVRRVVAFAGLFAGVGAATLTSANTSTYIATSFGITSALWAHVVTYTVIVTFAVLLFEVLGAVYQRYLDMLIAPAFDRLTGTLAGAVVGTFQVTVVLIVGVGVVKAQLPPGYSYPPAFLTAQDWFNGSLLAQHFYGLEPLTRTIFSLVLPGSISSYFTQLLTH